jgi:hypothetical protein
LTSPVLRREPKYKILSREKFSSRRKELLVFVAWTQINGELKPEPLRSFLAASTV